MPATKTGVLLENATTTGYGNWFGPTQVGAKTAQAHVKGTGAVTATVKIEVTNSTTLSTSAITALTFNLSGTTTAVDGSVITTPTWGYYRANVTAISGTGATVNVVMGE